MCISRDQRLEILKTPGNRQRHLVEPLNLTCEICGTKRARRILPDSLSLCCVMRADRCPGVVPPEGAVCFGCGAPAVMKTKRGWTCGTGGHYGCSSLARVAVDGVSRGNRELWDDPVRREATLAKHRATTRENYGVDNPTQSPVVRARIEAKVLERYGVPNASQSPILRERARQTFQARYGVDNNSQRPECRRRLINLVIERFGARSIVCSPTWRAGYLARTGEDHPMKHPEHQKAQREAFEAIYGGYPSQDPNVVLKHKQTCLRRYGLPHGLTPEVDARRREHNHLKYGTDYPAQNPEVWARSYLPRLYRVQQHTLASGRVIRFQGYELRPLLAYMGDYGENNVLSNGEVAINYTHGGKQRVYYPDFAIKSERIMVEIKSAYTFARALESTLIAKLSAAVGEGWIPIVEVWTAKSLVARLTYTNVLSLVTP